MEYPKPLKLLDQEQALAKAQSYCAYQERCQQEVRDKLYSWGLWTDTVEEIIAQLILSNFINEQRFAIAFAGGKFRIKKWGKIKIKSALKKRNITDYCIQKAFMEINDDDYRNTLEGLVKSAMSTIKKTTNYRLATYKVLRYAASKGFEENLIWEIVNTLKPPVSGLSKKKN